MQLRFDDLYDVLFGLREVVVPRVSALLLLFDVPSPDRLSPRAAADLFDALYPGLLSRYLASVACQCWIAGELPLWALTQDSEVEQVTWRPGRSIDWPDTIVGVAIAEYKAAGLLALEDKPLLHRREGILTSKAGARRLRAHLQTEIGKRPKGTKATQAEIEQWLVEQGGRAHSEREMMARAKQFFADRELPRSRFRKVHASLQQENKIPKPPRGRPWKK